MNGKNLGPPTEAQCHYTECHNLNNNCSNDLKSYATHPQLYSQCPCITLGSVNPCPMPVALWKKTATLQAENCSAFYICYYRCSSFKTPFSAVSIKFTQEFPIPKINLS